MSASALNLLVAASIASTAAILIVALIRKPLRQLSGPQAACWIWLLVPACTVAVFLPMPSQAVQIASQIAASTFVLPLPSPDSTAIAASGAVPLLVWLAGCLAMAALLAKRPRKFFRSLGDLTRAADGTYPSAAVTAPVLIGILRPRIVVPVDFDVRYGVRERALMLAHELAHRERGDVLVSAVAAIWLCVFWFNPLLYWAVSRLRFDQELACDAMVLSTLQAGRRRYARTLLKAQLAADSPWRIPVSCHWLSAHPLQERIAMLKQPFPGFARRSLGIFLTSALIVASSGLVWACTREPAGLEWSADRVVKLPNGDLSLSGNVSLAPGRPGAAHVAYSAERIAKIDDTVYMEGAVVISLGQQTLTTDRATVEKDGIVRMASAVLSPAR